MPTTNKLTDAMCRRAVPADKAIKLFDGGSLFLFVSPKGAKVWRLAYRLHGKPQQMSLGPYPLLSLADARTKRDEIKRAMLDGADPMAKRRSTRAAVTLEQCARDFLATRGAWSESYRENAQRALEMHILPHLGSRPIASITRDDLLEVLMLIDAKGKHVWARKLRMWCGQVWDYAVEHGHAAANVAATIKPSKAFGSKVVEHFPSLELHEVPAFMERLSLEPPLQSVLQCKFLALTWVRTKEARAMRWDQIDGDLWRVPSGTMKKRRPHLVPLSTQALQLLKMLRAMTRSEFVFPAPHRLDRTASENAVLALIARIGALSQHGPATVLRRFHESQFAPGKSRFGMKRHTAPQVVQRCVGAGSLLHEPPNWAFKARRLTARP